VPDGAGSRSAGWPRNDYCGGSEANFQGEAGPPHRRQPSDREGRRRRPVRPTSRPCRAGNGRSGAVSTRSSTRRGTVGVVDPAGGRPARLGSVAPPGFQGTTVRLPASLQHFLILWALGALATVIGLAVVTALVVKDHGWLGDLRLVNAGVTTRAVVMRIDRGNHCLAEYSFAVGGHSYTGSGVDCIAQVGQSVIITYLPSNPTHSCLGLARDALGNEITTFAIGSVVFPPCVFFAVRRWRRGRRVESTGLASS
jgi:uncharacterized protein DUF3592